MTKEIEVLTKSSTGITIGDKFTFVTYVDGTPTELTGSVEVMMPSSKARALGLTKSKRRRLGLLLRVPGYEELIYKDRGQVKSAPTEER